MAVAFAFALQAFVGITLLTQTTALDASPFVICVTNSDGTPDHGGEGKSSAHNHCALCALAKGAFDAPSMARATALDPTFSLIRNPLATERVAHFVSPTGQYQRGPPPTA